MERLASPKTASFFKRYPCLKYPSGKDVILAGDEPKGVYYVESGFVRQYDINAKNGLELTTHVYTPGSFFPLTWALADIDNRYFYSAMGPTRLYLVPKKPLRQFLLKNPDLSLELCERLLKGIEALTTRIKYLALGDAEQKIVSELLYLARHLGLREEETVLIGHRFTHQNLADLTGMARETVSHVLENLTKRGLLTDTEHHIVIHDLKELEKIANL